MLLLNRQNTASALSKELEQRKPRGRSLFPDTHRSLVHSPKGEGGFAVGGFNFSGKAGRKLVLASSSSSKK